MNTIEDVLDKHFPHDYYYEGGNITKRKLHERDCNRCRYDEQVQAAMQEWASLQTPPTNSERELLAVQSKSLLQLNGKLMEQKARIAELEKGLKNLIFTASKLWDDVKPIKDTDIMKVTHPTIEETRKLLNL